MSDNDDKQITKARRRGKHLIIIGFVSIAILFLVYSRYQNPELLTPEAIEPLLRIANAFYVILLLALGAIAYGLYIYHKQKIEEGRKDLTTIIALSTWNSKSRKIWLVTFIVYGIFFSLSSGTLLYMPEVSFSYHYGATIPSGFIAPCCDNPGYMPTIIVYLTDHIGLQVIPVNLVLQIIVSYLVALNMSLAITAISISRKSRSIGTLGATTGLFIACPTCAGTFLSLFIGTASGISAAIVLTQLQTLFIAISIPILLATPFIIAKKLRNADGSCKIIPK